MKNAPNGRDGDQERSHLHSLGLNVGSVVDVEREKERKVFL